MEEKENYAILMRVAMLSALEARYTTRSLGFRCARNSETGNEYNEMDYRIIFSGGNDCLVRERKFAAADVRLSVAGFSRKPVC